MKLGTHEERIAALEAALEKAYAQTENAMERAAIVEVADRIAGSKFSRDRDTGGRGMASAHQMSGYQQ